MISPDSYSLKQVRNIIQRIWQIEAGYRVMNQNPEPGNASFLLTAIDSYRKEFPEELKKTYESNTNISALEEKANQILRKNS